MSVELSGNSPATLTAGILLMSRARTFGQRMAVSVVGNPSEITPVEGPAMVHSAVLASCGVGERPGNGAVVVIPGPADQPLAVSLADGGIGTWFTLDRRGTGEHAATQALVRLCRSPEPERRRLGREALQALRALGCMPEPAVVDLLLHAPVSPYHRLVLGLRAGRSMNSRGDLAVHSHLADGVVSLPDALPIPCALADVEAAAADGRLEALAARLGPKVRAAVWSWLGAIRQLAPVDPDAAVLLGAILDLAGPVLALPSPVVLPTLDPASDGIAVALPSALGATRGNHDAARMLVDTFQFLGGKFVSQARFPVAIPGAAPPEGRLARWRWFCESTRTAADTADALWRRVIDPIQ